MGFDSGDAMLSPADASASQQLSGSWGGTASSAMTLLQVRGRSGSQPPPLTKDQLSHARALLKELQVYYEMSAVMNPSQKMSAIKRHLEKDFEDFSRLCAIIADRRVNSKASRAGKATVSLEDMTAICALLRDWSAADLLKIDNRTFYYALQSRETKHAPDRTDAERRDAKLSLLRDLGLQTQPAGRATAACSTASASALEPKFRAAQARLEEASRPTAEAVEAALEKVRRATELLVRPDAAGYLAEHAQAARDLAEALRAAVERCAGEGALSVSFALPGVDVASPPLPSLDEHRVSTHDDHHEVRQSPGLSGGLRARLGSTLPQSLLLRRDTAQTEPPRELSASESGASFGEGGTVCMSAPPQSRDANGLGPPQGRASAKRARYDRAGRDMWPPYKGERETSTSLKSEHARYDVGHTASWQPDIDLQQLHQLEQQHQHDQFGQQQQQQQHEAMRVQRSQSVHAGFGAQLDYLLERSESEPCAEPGAAAPGNLHSPGMLEEDGDAAKRRRDAADEELWDFGLFNFDNGMDMNPDDELA